MKAHIFNNTIWPDFSKSRHRRRRLSLFIRWNSAQTLNLAHKHIEVLPAVHTVPAAGYAISSGDLASGSAAWVFTGDTEQNPALWARINQLKVAMLVIETAFSNRESDLARRSLHLSPQALASELDCIAPAPATRSTSPTPNLPKPNSSWPRSTASSRPARSATRQRMTSGGCGLGRRLRFETTCRGRQKCQLQASSLSKNVTQQRETLQVSSSKSQA